MQEFHADYSARPPLQAIFESARHFGLSTDEAWRTVNDCLYEAVGDATVAEYLDELTGALARRVLARERRILAQERRILSEEAF